MLIHHIYLFAVNSKIKVLRILTYVNKSLHLCMHSFIFFPWNITSIIEVPRLLSSTPHRTFG